MRYCFYKINEIPDLTLAKYQSLGENGIEAVLNKHDSFLRQWQGLSDMCDIQIHIIYFYEPSKATGSKFEVYLGYTYGEKILDSQIENIMKVTPLSDYFQFKKIQDFFFIQASVLPEDLSRYRARSLARPNSTSVNMRW